MPKSWSKPTKEVVKAMNEVVSEMSDIDIKPVMPTDEEPGTPADKQLLIRCTESERELWKAAAAKNNETMASFVRRVLNESAQKATTCSHPRNQVKLYSWGKPPLYCLACQTRIEPGQVGT